MNPADGRVLQLVMPDSWLVLLAASLMTFVALGLLSLLVWWLMWLQREGRLRTARVDVSESGGTRDSRHADAELLRKDELRAAKSSAAKAQEEARSARGELEDVQRRAANAQRAIASADAALEAARAWGSCRDAEARLHTAVRGGGSAMKYLESVRTSRRSLEGSQGWQRIEQADPGPLVVVESEGTDQVRPEVFPALEFPRGGLMLPGLHAVMVPRSALNLRDDEDVKLLRLLSRDEDAVQEIVAAAATLARAWTDAVAPDVATQRSARAVIANAWLDAVLHRPAARLMELAPLGLVEASLVQAWAKWVERVAVLAREAGATIGPLLGESACAGATTIDWRCIPGEDAVAAGSVWLQLPRGRGEPGIRIRPTPAEDLIEETTIRLVRATTAGVSDSVGRAREAWRACDEYLVEREQQETPSPQSVSTFANDLWFAWEQLIRLAPIQATGGRDLVRETLGDRRLQESLRLKHWVMLVMPDAEDLSLNDFEPGDATDPVGSWPALYSIEPGQPNRMFRKPGRRRENAHAR